MEQGHHLVLMQNNDKKDVEFPLGVAIADEHGELICYVSLDLPTANKFGEKFCELYNETLIKVRGDT